MAAAVVNGKIYVIGGIDISGYLKTVEVYDPSSDSWSTAALMPTARELLAVASVNGSIYAIGGVGGGSVVSTVEVYDPSSDSWSTATSMNIARCQLAAAEANGLVYAIGGNNASFTWAKGVERYSPPVTIYTFIKN